MLAEICMGLVLIAGTGALITLAVFSISGLICILIDWFKKH